MSQNDQILLTHILNQRKQEIAPELKDSDYFEIFSAEQILKDYDLSYDEIRSGIVGGGGDGGIDSIYIFVNGALIQEDSDTTSFKRNITIHLVIIQSKTSKGFSESSIEKFNSSTRDLLDLSNNIDDLAAVYSVGLLNVIKRFRNIYTTFASRFPSLTISYYYATKGIAVDPKVTRKTKHLSEIVAKLFSSAQFNFQFIDAGDLLTLARQAPTTSFKLTLVENAISTGETNILVSPVDIAFSTNVNLKDVVGA